MKTYPNPFFMSYLTNLSYMLYFIFWVFNDPINHLTRSSKTEEESNPDIKIYELPPLTRTQIAKVAFVFFFLYLSSNYATNMAYQKTSVSSTSILAATCGLFTLIFGWVMGVEVLSVMRILAVLISAGGVLLLGIPDLMKSDSTAIGNTFALMGAIFYGVYSIFLKRVAVDESRISMPILFAFSGLYTLLFAWPILVGLDYFGIEPFKLPTGKMLYYVLLNVILGGFVPNYLWNVAFVCTSPLVVAIGISFSIPITLTIEYFCGNPAPMLRVLSGLLIVMGFIIVNLANIFPKWDLAAEKLLVKIGLMNEQDVKGTEERAALKRSQLLRSSRLSP